MCLTTEPETSVVIDRKITIVWGRRRYLREMFWNLGQGVQGLELRGHVGVHESFYSDAFAVKHLEEYGRYRAHFNAGERSGWE